MPVQLSATFHTSKSNPNAIETVDIVLNQWKFPGGEIGIRLMDEVFEDETYNITVNGIISSDDIISLANIFAELPIPNISFVYPLFSKMFFAVTPIFLKWEYTSLGFSFISTTHKQLA